MSRYLADRIERSPVEVMLNSAVRELAGDGALEHLTVENTITGEQQRVVARALFVFIGAEPHTQWLQGQLALDRRGFVLTGPAAQRDHGRGARAPSLLESCRSGVLAVGDVRSGSIKRVSSAVGEGSMAVRLIHEHLERMDQHPHYVP
jgi:thioredoxin reductase (NADPH)